MAGTTFVSAAVLAAVALAPGGGTVEPRASATTTDQCSRQYTRAEFRAEARAVYRSPRLGNGRGRDLRRMRRCARRPQINRPLERRIMRTWRQWRKTTGRWYLIYSRFPAWVKAKLDSIASCESGGSPTAVSSTGAYRGKYQFSFATWATSAAGYGSGDPAAASEREQDVRAGWLLMREGPGHWPVCG